MIFYVETFFLYLSRVFIEFYIDANDQIVLSLFTFFWNLWVFPW